MGKEKAKKFHKKIHEKIDKEIQFQKKIELAGKNVNFLLRSEYQEKLRKVENLRKKLKLEFNALRAADLAITRQEMKAIYGTIPKELLETFNIKDIEELKAFIGISEIEEQKIYEEAVDASSSSKSEQFYKNIRKYEKQPWLKQFLIDNETDAFVYFKFLKHIPWIKVVLNKIIKKRPHLAFYFMNEYKMMPWAKELAIMALPRATKFAFRFLKHYTDQPWANEIITKAIKILPIYEYDDKILKVVIENENNPKLSKLLNPFKKKLEDIMQIGNAILYQQKLKQRELFVEKKLSRGEVIFFTRRYMSKLRKLFFKDPAFKLILKIKSEYFVPKPKNEKMLIQYRVMVCRNLYFKNIPITKNNILKEYQSILALRQEYAKLPLFKDKNVLYIAHNEKITDEYYQHYEKHLYNTNLFGKKASIDAIRKQGGKVTLMRAKNNLASLKRKKKAILERVVNTPKLTLVFDGHGSKEALYLTGGDIVQGKPSETKDTIKITYRELAKAFMQRHIKFPKEKPPIIVLWGCYNHTFLRNFYKTLGSSFTQPIIIGGGEYNMLLHRHEKNKYGNEFFEKVLQLSKKGHVTTVGTVMRYEELGSGNSSVYIPSRKGKKPVQIAAKDMRKPPSA
jgi:hypothetical protein